MMEVLRAAPLTTVQDLGRSGWRHLGVYAGGAMDTLALQQANALLGNAPGAAALELVAGPLRLRLHRDAWVVQAGALFELRIDGVLQPSYWRRHVAAGQELELRGPQRGQYGLLAVDGGIDLPACLGSRATALRAGFGGHEGRALEAGDQLPLGKPSNLKRPRGIQPAVAHGSLGLLTGPEWPQLEQASRDAFWGAEWKLAPQSDRMGLRLSGPRLVWLGRELPSHAVLPGLLQLPPGGQPILLGADAQTTGGYPRIGQVMAADLWKLAHLRPGQSLRFLPMDLDSARQRLAQQAEALTQLRDWVHALDRLER